jgi:hypothetical protein
MGSEASTPGERKEHKVALPESKNGVHHYQVSAQHERGAFQAGVSFSRGPYRQNISATGVSVLWADNSSSEAAAVLIAEGLAPQSVPQDERGVSGLTL